jgi:general secretion pathway protein K
MKVLTRYNPLQQGAALITALFIMAIIAAASVAMMIQTEVSIRQTNTIIDYHRAYFYSELVQDWARDNLLADLQSKSTPIDVFPKIYQKTEIPGGYFTGQILDMQGKFNINNLNASLKARFTNLLTAVVPNIQNPAVLTQNIIDWLSPTDDSAVDQAYQKAGLTYKVEHRSMVNITQLRQVLGMTQPIYQALLPYVTALPTFGTTINPNTAAAPVLLMLADGLSLSTAQDIAQAAPFNTDGDFYNNPVVKNHGIGGGASTQSQYFLSNALVKLGDQTLLLNSLLYRTTINNNQPAVLVYWQNQGNI